MYSARVLGLLVVAPGALESVPMADPRTQLTAQELIYPATALGAEARRAERQAADPQFESCRALFENSMAANDAPWQASSRGLPKVFGLGGV